MNKKNILLLVAVLALLFILPAANADYSFEVPKAGTILKLENDGTMTVYVEYQFNNLGQKLDYIDIGLPNNNYSLNEITVALDGETTQDIKVTKADYQQTGLRYGITLEMGSRSIPSGGSGTVAVTIPNLQKNIFEATSETVEENEIEYVGFEFSPNYFGKKFVKGTSDYEFTIVFPEDLGAEQVYYYLPQNWPGNNEPEAWISNDGRVVYNWVDSSANVYTEYVFGGKYPKSILTTTSNITAVSSGGTDSSSDSEWWEALLGVFICFVPIVGFIIYVVKKMIEGIKGFRDITTGSYLPPQIKSDGEGIKRGLTAVEAAILLEMDLERVLSMILYGLSKKEIIKVTSQDPLEVEVTDQLPDTLYDYEKDFITALQQKSITDKKRKMRDAMERLILSVTKKMEGFSVKETREYYQSICDKAWAQVEAAETPEMKSKLLGDNFGWAMLQEDPEKKIEQTFSGYDLYPPTWWWRIDPGYHRSYQHSSPSPSTETVSSGSDKHSGPVPSSSKHSPMPVLPGAMFARSIVNSAKGFGNSVVGNMNQFNSSVKNRTNPAPIQSYSSSSHSSGSSGGSSCACACACASCACACAGGGR